MSLLYVVMILVDISLCGTVISKFKLMGLRTFRRLNHIAVVRRTQKLVVRVPILFCFMIENMRSNAQCVDRMTKARSRLKKLHIVQPIKDMKMLLSKT